MQLLVALGLLGESLPLVLLDHAALLESRVELPMLGERSSEV